MLYNRIKHIPSFDETRCSIFTWGPSNLELTASKNLASSPGLCAAVSSWILCDSTIVVLVSETTEFDGNVVFISVASEICVRTVFVSGST